MSLRDASPVWSVSDGLGRSRRTPRSPQIRGRKKEAAMIESDERIYSRFLAEGNEEDFCALLERHKENLMLFL
jgi:hypothetical protein